ncbi:Aldehyde-alcohol dehydrogenase [compost metagenome]
MCKDRYAQLARNLGLPGSDDNELVDALIAAIGQLNTKLGIARTLKEHGVTEATFENSLDFIAEQAEKDPCTGSNPRQPTVADLKRILTCAMYGEQVDF